jgi:uroporphyrinogen decarboxylase
MTPKERIRAAMNLEPVDKVPLMCQMSIGHMLLQLKVSPAEFWFDSKVFADGLIKLREQYNFDGILISLHGHDPDWRKRVNQISRSEDGETVEWNNSDKTVCPYNELPREFKQNQIHLYDFDSFDISNLPARLDYIPVSQGLHFELNEDHLFDIFYDIVKRQGENYSIHGEITSPLDYLFDLFGIQNSLMGLICDPNAVNMIMQHFTNLIIELAVEMSKTGIDAIKLSSPFAGAGFISPEHYSEFVVPYEKQVAQAIRNQGVHVYTHTCGHISDRLELMFESGISGIECLDPAPIGNVELEDAIKRIGQKGFIKGNLDSVNLLLNSSEDEIRKQLKRTIEISKETPGFILSTACSIAPNARKENILLLSKAVEKWG